MKKIVVLMGMFGILVAGSASSAPLTVGEKWAYKHEGPRPFSRGEEAIEGDRTIEVTKVEGSGEEKRWVVEEKWGTYDENPSLFYVDAKNLIHKREVGYQFSMRYDPPLPMEYSSLKPGEKKEFEVKQFWGDGDRSIPLKVSVERLEDETVKVPAGEFKNCTHVREQTEFTFSREDREITFKRQNDYWYHPEVNSFVKHTFKSPPMRFGDQERPGRSGTSVLKQHKIEKKED